MVGCQGFSFWSIILTTRDFDNYLNVSITIVFIFSCEHCCMMSLKYPILSQYNVGECMKEWCIRYGNCYTTSYVLYGNNFGKQITIHGFGLPLMQDADPTPQYDFHVSEK